MVDVAGQAKVSDLHHIILGDQHVPGSQISMDALREKRGGGELRGSGHIVSSPAGGSHLPGGQVRHPPGHLVGGGDQLHKLHVGQGDGPRAAPVLQADGPAGSEVLPQVALRGVFHHHVQRAWRQRKFEKPLG